MTTLITNSTEENHHTFLLERLQESTEAFFAAAFLKSAGLTLLLPALQAFLASGKSITIVAGQHFALTEPKALHTLRELFRRYPKSKIYLDKALSPTKVFHPKLYLFQSDAGCCIVSANLTKGGLISNSESSVAIRCRQQDKLWADARVLFDQLISPENAQEATTLIIKQYETYFERQKANNQNVKPVPPPLTGFFAELRKQFEAFNDNKRSANYRIRKSRYQEAKDILDLIADSTRLSQKQFASLLDRLVGSKGQGRLWHSGSLFRLRRSVYPYHQEFRELVQYIRQQRQAPAASIFTGAMNRVQAINGASVNYVTEIMMTYNPKQFANLNKNPLTTLRTHGAAHIKATSASYNGDDYEVYCKLVADISGLLGLKDMLEADSFFDSLYWKTE